MNVSTPNILRQNLQTNQRPARTALKLGLISVSAIALIQSESAALAQTSVPDERPTIDSNGVDLSTGKVNLEVLEGSLGALSASRIRGQDDRSSDTTYVIDNLSTKQVVIGNNRSNYVPDGTNRWKAESGDGGVLTRTTSVSAGIQTITYTLEASSGATIIFNERSDIPQCGDAYSSCGEEPYRVILATSITGPTGVEQELQYDVGSVCLEDIWNTCIEALNVHRLERVTSNDGLEVRYIYQSNNTPTANQGNTPDYNGWSSIDRVQTINLAQNHCNPYPAVCTGSSVRNTRSLNFGRTTRNHVGQDIVFTKNNAGRLIGVRPPGYSSDKMTFSYNSVNRVSQVTSFGVTSTYTFTENIAGNEFIAVKTTGGMSERYVFNLAGTELKSYEGIDGVETTFTYDMPGRVTSIEREDGLATSRVFDDRGNVTQTTLTPKDGSNLAPIVTSSSFDTNCANGVTCNLPNSSLDPLANTTTYTWDSASGLPTRIEAPSPAPGQPRPTVTNSYATFYGRYKNSSGSLVNYAQGRTLLSQTRECLTAATCVGSSNERVTTYEYNHPNLMPTKITVSTGNSTLSQITTMGYDARLNLAWIDGPLPGSGDRVRFFYDALDRQIGAISPDPDNGGPLPRPAERVVYDSANRVLRREYGTVTATNSGAVSSMTATRSVQYVYDGNGRVLQEKYLVGSNVIALSQTSYDTIGRISCVAQRMDPSKYSSLPSSACVQSSSSGALRDRISRYNYANNGRLAGVEVGVGTPLAQTTVSYGYDTVGNVTSTTDARGFRTTYEFDGFDRQRRTLYPSASLVGVSNGNDDEIITYDGAGRVASVRTRANETINFVYDDLGRLIQKDLPYRAGFPAAYQRDIYYSYDLGGNLTFARMAGTPSNEGISFSINGLGQLVSTTQALDGRTRTISYQYDAAGRRTRVTHPDGQYWRMDYDNLGRMVAIDERSSEIGQVTFNSQGQPITQSWTGATSTSYSFDSAERLSGININLAGTASDLNLAYSHNQAGQIVSETASNDAYSWDGGISVSRNYTANGLNQYQSAGSSNFCYDQNGNLTADGSSVYRYDIENRLVERRVQTNTNCSSLSYSGTLQSGLRYDPLGRLYETSGPSGTTVFLHDGSDLIAEYNASGALRDRYVHGVNGGDDPLIWYDGSAVSSSSRRLLQKDRLGSIIATTNASGSALNLNSYDEFGINGTGNSGRFQFTGQAWLGDMGLYHFKARAYSPTLGRFLQPDPLRYADGPNMYAYVGNDPANAVDPTGLARENIGPFNCGYGYISASEVVDDDGNVVAPSQGRRRSNYGDCRLRDIFARERSALDAAVLLARLLGAHRDEVELDIRSHLASISDLESLPGTDVCTSGTRINLGVGLSATAFLGLTDGQTWNLGGGFSGSAGASISIPIESLLNFSLKGAQAIPIQASGSVLIGNGAYAGAGESFTVGYHEGPIPHYDITDTVSSSDVLMAGLAKGVGGEASYLFDSDSASVSGGPRAGYGGFYGYGKRGDFTVATAPIGCP